MKIDVYAYAITIYEIITQKFTAKPTMTREIFIERVKSGKINVFV
jgi:hypothetical protein